MRTVTRAIRVFVFGTAFTGMISPVLAMTTAEELAQHCLSLCGVFGEGGLSKLEIASPDRCAGYLKGTIGAARVLGYEGQKTTLKSCELAVLSKRTAAAPQEDQLLSAMCSFGKWVSARPSMQNKSATSGILQWANATGCNAN